MTNEEIEARSEAAVNFAGKVADLAIRHKVNMDVAGISFIHLTAAAIAETFGPQAGEDFYCMMDDFVASHVQQDQSPEEKKFWNLMAEKGYDNPVAFPKKAASAGK